MWRPITGWEVWLPDGYCYCYFKTRGDCVDFLRQVESISPDAADGAECEEKELLGWKDGESKWLEPNVAFSNWKRWNT